MENMSTGNKSISSILNFVRLLGKLKHTKRAGWVRQSVPDCESVADHMYRMAVMAMMLPGNGNLDRDRCVRLSLVHDIAECIVGDITPADKVPKDIKHAKELAAITDIQKLVPPEFSDELLKLWREYEDQASPEAKYVKDLDRFDMVMQAHEYEEELKRPGELQEFFDSTTGRFQHPEILTWVDEINKVRALPEKDDTS